jgi:membrane protein
MTEAAAITFYSLLALFPALTALVSIYGLFADPASISDHVAAASGVVPGGGMQIITDQVHSLAANGGKALGLGAVLGLTASLWSANQGTKALFDALNVVYGEQEKRGFVRRTAVTLAFTVGGILFVLIAMGAVVAVPLVINFMGLSGVTDLLLRFLRWPVLLVVVAAVLACIYRVGPSRQSARWRWVTWGGGFAAVTWLLSSIAFSWYVSHFGSYNKTYGSLGAAIGFMTWIWLSATVVLVGAELNAEMEHQTARDTTTGPEKAVGTRGATKADAVASA